MLGMLLLLLLLAALATGMQKNDTVVGRAQARVRAAEIVNNIVVQLSAAHNILSSQHSTNPSYLLRYIPTRYIIITHYSNVQYNIITLQLCALRSRTSVE